MTIVRQPDRIRNDCCRFGVSHRDETPIDFLSALSEDEGAAFRAVGHVRRFGTGETVFHEGDDPGGVVAILSGRVKVWLSGVGGREVVLRFSSAGELVGELAAIADRPRTATVTAVDQVEAIAVRASEFRRFIAEHPGVAPLVFDHVAQLLAEADRQRIDFATRDVTARIASRLVQLAAPTEPAGEPRPDDPRISLRLSQEELAAWTGASREAVARSLHLLRELGWVETHRREIRVLNADALRRLIA
jgi:CRP/FNR family transcriptional regulator, cyclic AMP receptor protein